MVFNCDTCITIKCPLEMSERSLYKGTDFEIMLKQNVLCKIGCTSHSDFNKPKKAHDVEEFYKEERVPKYKDTIFEETKDGGAIIGYLTESPSGCPRPNMSKLTKKQYTDYKKNNVNYGD
jgi:hypothetical protein